MTEQEEKDAQNELGLKETRKLRQAYAQTFNTEVGGVVLEDLKKRCYFSKPTFSEVSTNGENGDHREGMRSVILTIESIMTLKLEEE